MSTGTYWERFWLQQQSRQASMAVAAPVAAHPRARAEDDSTWHHARKVRRPQCPMA